MSGKHFLHTISMLCAGEIRGRTRRTDEVVKAELLFLLEAQHLLHDGRQSGAQGASVGLVEVSAVERGRRHDGSSIEEGHAGIL